MFKRVLDKMRRAAESEVGLRLRDNDFDILEVLCIEKLNPKTTFE